MKILTSIIVLTFYISSLSFGQDAFVSEDNYYTNDNVKTNNSEDELELLNFLKIQDQVIKKIQTQIEYPELAYEYRIEGSVLVEFIFNGEISNIKVVESLDGGCDQAALKALKNYTKYYKELGGKDIKARRIAVPFKFEFI